MIKNNKFKLVMSVSLLSIFSFLFSTSVYALNEESYSIEDNGIYTCRNDFGKVYLPKVDIVNNNEISYYCEFVEPQEALRYVNEVYADFISYLNSNYNMPVKITENNWKKYYNELSNLEKSVNEINGFSNLLAFFDIYENKEKNDEIRQFIGSMISSSTSLSSTYNENLMYQINSLVPMYSDKFNINDNVSYLQRTRSGMNVSAAVWYANTYSNSANSNFVYYSNGDCTNFVSQILNHSGVSQVVGVGPSFGWWYALGKHSYSWGGATNFINYWGYDIGTNDFSYLSQNVQQGDVISFDRSSDGSADHLGFVSDTSSTTYTYTTNAGKRITYRNFKVAQHTGNYNAWVNSSENGWETYTDSQYDASYFISRFH